ncbi:MAG: hypothetical protein GXO10_01940 [Crenarchaeota archaeon]|nr:hypothetical protein [Thermoproteota archaeon]
MSGKLDRVVILVLQLSISIVSAVLLSYLILIVPLLRYFTYVAEYSIGIYVNPFLASFMFFSAVFLTYSIASRTCRLGPLVCTIMCIIVLFFNSPIVYLMTLRIEQVSKIIASTVGTFVRGFYIPSNDLVYVSMLCVVSTLMLILSRVIENSYAIEELVFIKRVPLLGSFSNIVITTSLILISLAFITLGALLEISHTWTSVPVGISLISIGLTCLLVMILILARGRT